MPVISVKDVSLGYDGKAILSGLNFTVNEGDYLCIVGENGSGKSTLMKTLLNLQQPLSGTIERGELKAGEIGYLPQQTEIQRDFPASVYEIVLSGTLGGIKKRFFYTAEDKKNAMENMERMRITDLKDQCYRNLSGGQQQRVLLARALCAAKKILLLDEPVTGLDPKVSIELYSVIRQLNRQGITIIMISHDIGAAVRYASHILHIGDHVYFGTKEEYAASKTGRFFLNSEEA
ncbi:MAG: metal ABC transporter ATP-binding protein [Solobacterium sp.]|nr:metal ABC transporter ATP-binding protein [Solobacterium sp.]